MKINGFTAGDGDVLSATAQGGVTVSYNSSTGVLTLSGTASAATYQSVLDSVKYSYVGDPTKGGSEPTRTLSWQIRDANTIVGENTAGDTSTINVTHAPPSIGGNLRHAVEGHHQ